MEKKKLVGVCFILLFAYLVLQYSKVSIFYDDYGYLSLSYGYTVQTVEGHHFTLGQLMEFISAHYSYVNGRLLYTFLYLICYLAGGLTMVRLMMACIVTADVYLAYRLVCKFHKLDGGKRVLLAAFCCLLFGTVGVLIQRQGSYWYAASFTYLTPCIPLLILMNLLYEPPEKRSSPGSVVLLCALAFASGFSQEQWFVAAMTGIFGMMAVRWYQTKKMPLWDLVYAGCALAGGLLIILSPAAVGRLHSESNAGFSQIGLVDKVVGNTRVILDMFFGPQNPLYLKLLLVCLFLMVCWLLETRKGNRIVHGIYLAYTAAMIMWSATIVVNRYMFLAGFLVFTVGEVSYFYYVKKQALGELLFLMGVMSLACMAVVPELPNRIIMQFILLSFVLMGDILACYLEQWNMSVVLLMVLLAGCFSIPNMKEMYRGYAVNYQVLSSNEKIILEAVEHHKPGEAVELILRQEPDMRYGNEMVYQEQFSYMIYWMREYYQIPNEITLKYVEE